jgi:hypothetical protein
MGKLEVRLYMRFHGPFPVNNNHISNLDIVVQVMATEKMVHTKALMPILIILGTIISQKCHPPEVLKALTHQQVSTNSQSAGTQWQGGGIILQLAICVHSSRRVIGSQLQPSC